MAMMKSIIKIVFVLIVTLLVAILYICIFGGCSNNSNSSWMNASNWSESKEKPTAENKCCKVYGNDVELCKKIAFISLSELPSVEKFTEVIPGNKWKSLGPVTIRFVKKGKSEYSLRDDTIFLLDNMSDDRYHSVCGHEFVHRIHLHSKMYPVNETKWIPEVISESWEQKEHHEPPPDMKNILYDKLEEEEPDYTTQRQFGVWLMNEYGIDVIKKIVSCPYTGRDSILYATEEKTWEALINKWKRWR